MIVSIIVVRSENGVIGRDNELPWRLSADLKHFKTTTLGKPVLMGRKTHESIGKPLPGRANIVLTRDTEFEAAGCLVAHSFEEGIAVVGDLPELMVIGGEAVYRDALRLTRRIYVTEVHTTLDGDAFFPELNTGEWEEVARDRHSADEKNEYDYSFVILERTVFD